MASSPAGRPLLTAVALGTALQVAMVIGGHFSPAIAGLFALGGMLISMLAGGLYVLWSGAGGRTAALGGAVAGGVCALIGIGVSVALGDVPFTLLIFGTLSSAVTGMLGGLVASVVVARRRGVA